MNIKLRGTNIEQEFRDRLSGSRNWLLTTNKGQNVNNVLKQFCPQMIVAYILSSIPEQGEDFYKVLINDEIIIDIEVTHDNTATMIKSVSIPQYLKKLSKMNQIKLAVAIDLAKTALGNMGQ
ncbi:hypothetical protein J2T02_001727 [Chitinophaga terrae (ex Kim and Jung 2007)]|uniref:hypothetical protein n=1 Tax=Chitinophaga terrae (ex Kim and Jung 2007) TaxID=408074 RepID=UPI0027817427|nr:hypothetical protein [Chitinophaga terrae (ex Kim and Jung 2007)]MDQ0106616.1 hypothetical protein [Chitinophaga terrae (ex Kim and Jung 2007)]